MKVSLLIPIVATLLTAKAQQFRPIDEVSFPKLVATSKGKVLLVDFWATWCKPCRAEMPQIVKLAAKLKSKGLEVVTVSADEVEAEPAAWKFLSEMGAAGLPAYIKRPKDDDKFISLIDAKWSGELPALFLYDRGGRRVQAFYGETPVARIEAAIQKAGL